MALLSLRGTPVAVYVVASLALVLGGIDIALATTGHSAFRPVHVSAVLIAPSVVALLCAVWLRRAQHERSNEVEHALFGLECRINRRLEVLDHHYDGDQHTDEVPRLATAAEVGRVLSVIEGAARDRDLQMAAIHDAIDQVRQEAARELRESMRWVIQHMSDEES